MCIVNCKWGEWVLGDCSVDCGGGIQHNYREKIQEELFGGTCEGEASGKEGCKEDPCPGNIICQQIYALYNFLDK